MVVDWEDEDKESEMRGILEKNGFPPVITTPYKKTSEQEVYDEFGNKIYFGEITITRSEKYFNIDTGEKLNKTESEISNEFNKNVEIIKQQILTEKPSPETPKEETENAEKIEQEYSSYLLKLQRDLMKYNIKTEIINGKLVRV